VSLYLVELSRYGLTLSANSRSALNFYEKALFVKPPVAALYRSRVQRPLCPSRPAVEAEVTEFRPKLPAAPVPEAKREVTTCP